MCAVGLFPGDFELLSRIHGEVGFLRARVQNDASSVAHYEALILGGATQGMYRRRQEERKIRRAGGTNGSERGFASVNVWNVRRRNRTVDGDFMKFKLGHARLIHHRNARW